MQDNELLNELQLVLGDAEKVRRVALLFEEREQKWQQERETLLAQIVPPARRGRPPKPLPPEFETVYLAYRQHAISRLQAQARLQVSVDQFYRMIRKYEGK